MEYDISNDLTKEEELFARERLTQFNTPFAGATNFSEIGLALRDGDGALIGALYGTVVWSWLHVNVLWVDEAYRGKGLGRSLLDAAEREAARRGCRYAKLHTFSFQAKPFYEQRGYRAIAETPDFPEGHVQYLMFKPLMRDPAGSDSGKAGT